MNIIVHMSVDRATVPYALYAWNTMNSLATLPEQMTLMAHCMDESARAQMLSVPRASVVGVGEGIRGSNGHAMCIMDAFQFTGDGNIHVINDTDAVVVAKGWDTYVRQRVSDGVGFIGTTYEDVGKFSSGHGKLQTYKKVPNFIWAALGPQHSWRGLNIMPDKGKQIEVATEEQSKIYNLPIGYSVFGEAGYQVPLFVHQNNIKYEGWLQLKPTKDATVLAGLTDYSEEYHVEGVPTVVHQRGGRQFAFRQHPLSVNFFNVVDAYLAKEKSQPQRW